MYKSGFRLFPSAYSSPKSPPTGWRIEFWFHDRRIAAQRENLVRLVRSFFNVSILTKVYIYINITIAEYNVLRSVSTIDFVFIVCIIIHNAKKIRFGYLLRSCTINTRENFDRHLVLFGCMRTHIGVFQIFTDNGGGEELQMFFMFTFYYTR